MKTSSSLGRRAIAGIIDYGSIYLFTWVFIYSSGDYDYVEDSYTVTGLPMFIPIFFWFIMTVGLEQWIGHTLGNGIMNLRAYSLLGNKHRLTFGQSLKRHLLDPLDLFPFGLVALVAISNTQQHQRLGDIWAKTIVVKNSDLQANGDLRSI